MILMFLIFQSYKRLIPSQAIIYFSYVFGTEAERESLTILPRDEIKVRLKQAKATRTGFIMVTKPENKPAFEKFQLDVLNLFNGSVVVKTEESL